MTHSNLPHAIAALLQAVRKRDSSAFLAAFAREACLLDRDTEHRGNGIREWSDRFFQSDDTVHPINVASRQDKTIVTIVLKGGNGINGTAQQLDWTFTVHEGKVAAFMIASAQLPDLTPPVASYVMATNTFDLQTLVGTFADDAVVNDQLREFRGKTAIRDWADRDIIGNRMTMYVLRAVEHHGTVIVTANVDGDYDKRGLPDPLVLTFYFSMHRDEIIQLIILRNEPAI